MSHRHPRTAWIAQDTASAVVENLDRATGFDVDAHQVVHIRRVGFRLKEHVEAQFRRCRIEIEARRNNRTNDSIAVVEVTLDELAGAAVRLALTEVQAVILAVTKFGLAPLRNMPEVVAVGRIGHRCGAPKRHSVATRFSAQRVRRFERDLVG